MKIKSSSAGVRPSNELQRLDLMIEHHASPHINSVQGGLPFLYIVRQENQR